MRTSPTTRRRRPWAAACVAILTVLVTATGTATASPVRASNTVGSGSFGLTPTPSPTGRQRSYFDLAVSPGGSVQDTVIVSNTRAAVEDLKIGVSSAITAANSGTAYQSPSRACAGPACWVTGLPARLSLAPHERRLLAFRVAVPDGTAPAQYLVGITAEPATPPAAVHVGSNGQASAEAIFINKVTTGVAVTVGSLSRMRTGLTVSQVTATWIGSTPRLLIPVSNDGQRFVRATGTISCGAGADSRSYRVVMQTVLPGGSAMLPVNAPGLDRGQLPCTVRLDDDTEHPVSWSGTVNLPTTTQARVFHTGNGAYSVLPPSTTPIWAITLTVIGVLILAALLALLVLHHMRRRTQLAVGKARPCTTRELEMGAGPVVLPKLSYDLRSEKTEDQIGSVPPIQPLTDELFSRPPLSGPSTSDNPPANRPDQ